MNILRWLQTFYEWEQTFDFIFEQWKAGGEKAKNKVLFLDVIKFYNDNILFPFKRILLKTRMHRNLFICAVRLAGKLYEARSYVVHA